MRQSLPVFAQILHLIPPGTIEQLYVLRPLPNQDAGFLCTFQIYALMLGQLAGAIDWAKHRRRKAAAKLNTGNTNVMDWQVWTAMLLHMLLRACGVLLVMGKAPYTLRGSGVGGAMETNGPDGTVQNFWGNTASIRIWWERKHAYWPEFERCCARAMGQCGCIPGREKGVASSRENTRLQKDSFPRGFSVIFNLGR